MELGRALKLAARNTIEVSRHGSVEASRKFSKMRNFKISFTRPLEFLVGFALYIIILLRCSASNIITVQNLVHRVIFQNLHDFNRILFRYLSCREKNVWKVQYKVGFTILILHLQQCFKYHRYFSDSLYITITVIYFVCSTKWRLVQ